MRLLGQALYGAGVPFISATARHGRDGSQGEVVCETQEQGDAIAVWAKREGWAITTRVATPDEVAEHKRWQER